MKEDITQLITIDGGGINGCGLVMKEDITQRDAALHLMPRVVVW